MQHSTKKMKSYAAAESPASTCDEKMEETMSYKEKLLNVFGESETEEEFWDLEVEEQDFPENKWYIKNDQLRGILALNPLILILEFPAQRKSLNHGLSRGEIH